MFDRSTLPKSALALLLLATTLALPAIAAEPEPASVEAEAPPAPADPLDRIKERFRVIRLTDGFLLEPKSDDDGGLIEVGEGTLAIDGERVTAAELRQRLGAAAAPILELAGLESAPEPALADEILEETGATVVSELEPTTAPSPPQRPERPRRPRRSRSREDAQVIFGNDLTIEAGEVTSDAVVFGGDVRVEGKVIGDVATIGGSAWVDGEITGDLAVVGGTARLRSNALVRGDVVAVGGQLEIDDDADVRGEIVEVPFGPQLSIDWPEVGNMNPFRHAGRWYDFSPARHVFDFIWEIFGLILLAILACLALLFARRPVERVSERVAAEPFKAGLVGLATMILFWPLVLLVVIILTISIIGIPLLLLVPFAILAALIVAFVGYVGVAHRLGHFARRRFGWRIDNPYAVLLVGLGLIQVWSFVGEALDIGVGPIKFFAVMFLSFGFLVGFLAWLVGIGGAVLTRFGTRDSWEREAAFVPPPPPPSGPMSGAYELEPALSEDEVEAAAEEAAEEAFGGDGEPLDDDEAVDFSEEESDEPSGGKSG